MHLTPTERKVLIEIAQGKTNVRAANALGLSEQAIKNYMAILFDKLDCSNRTQAAIKALFGFLPDANEVAAVIEERWQNYPYH